MNSPTAFGASCARPAASRRLPTAARGCSAVSAARAAVSWPGVPSREQPLRCAPSMVRNGSPVRVRQWLSRRIPASRVSPLRGREAPDRRGTQRNTAGAARLRASAFPTRADTSAAPNMDRLPRRPPFDLLLGAGALRWVEVLPDTRVVAQQRGGAVGRAGRRRSKVQRAARARSPADGPAGR